MARKPGRNYCCQKSGVPIVGINPLGCAGLAPHFQIELSRPKRLNQMAVMAEATPAHASPEARAASARQLAQRIKSVIGISAEVRVMEPGSVPRSEGKAKRLIDLRPKG